MAESETIRDGNFRPFSVRLSSFHANVAPTRTDDMLYDIIIVGAGPAGLSSALQAHACGLDHVLLDGGCLAHGVALNLATEFSPGYEGYDAALKGPLWFEAAPKDTLLSRWRSQAGSVCLRQGEPAIDLSECHDDVSVLTPSMKYTARHVIIATGIDRLPFDTRHDCVSVVGLAAGAKSITESANQGFDAVNALRHGADLGEQPDCRDD